MDWVNHDKDGVIIGYQKIITVSPWTWRIGWSMIHVKEEEGSERLLLSVHESGDKEE